MSVRNTPPSLLRRINDSTTYITRIMAMFSGALFLGLALYMTVDVISRKLGGPFSGVADEVAGYILACSGSWSLAYALAAKSHVTIDVLIHYFSEKAQKMLYFFALVLLAGFASVLAFEMWAVTYASYKIHALPSGSLLTIPMAYPQALASFGMTMLVLQAVLLACEVFAELVSKKDSNETENEAAEMSEAPNTTMIKD